MEPSTPSHPPEAILEQLDWVRRLARSLCADASRAEDLSQEAMLAAVRRPPSADRPLARWLAGVVRNLVRQDRRREGRRHGLERAVARGEHLPSTLELIERVSLERALVRRVLALDEPYRTTVLLRYFEGLTPRAIAGRSGLPEATVKTRLRRALERLRRDLDHQRDPDGRSWLSALVPIAFPRGPLVAASTAGAVAVSLKTVALPLFVVTLGAGAWWMAERRPEPAAPDAVEASAPSGEPARAAATPLADAPRASGARVAAAEPPRPAAASPAPPAAASASTGTVAGIVVDTDEVPVAGCRIRLVPPNGAGRGSADPPAATSDARGRFELDLGSFGGGRLVADDPRFATVLETVVLARSGEQTVVVARRRLVEGDVVDEGGAPLEGVRLAYEGDSDLRRRFERPLDGCVAREWERETRAEGAFRFDGVPELPGARLVARRVGYVEAHVELQAHGDQNVHVVLASSVGDEDYVVGRVVDGRGGLVPEAWVSIGLISVQSDEAGGFQLPSDQGAAARRVLQAIKPGYLPGRLELPEGESWPPFVELVLGGPPLAIEGRVVDPRGEPVPGAHVSCANPTHFGGIVDRELGPDAFLIAFVEPLLRGSRRGDPVEAAADGAFRLEGLLDRSYRLLVVDPGSMNLFVSDPVRAGARGIELVLPDDPSRSTVAGRVLSGSGVPLAGAQLTASRQHHPRIEGSVDEYTDYLRGPQVEADEDGRFRFPGELVTTGVSIGVWGEGIAYTHVPLEGQPDPRDLLIVIPVQCRFAVQIADREALPARSFAIVDDKEQPLELVRRNAMSTIHMTSGQLQDSRSEVLTAPEGPATLILFDGEQELLRVPIVLVPGELNHIDV